MNQSPIEDNYKEDIKTFSQYIFLNQKPPKEKEIVFQPDLFKFSQNYKVGYSQYLTMLYGYKNQKEFETKYRPIVARWNRVLNRFINDEKITVDNFEELIFQGKELKQKGLIESEVEDAEN